MSSNSRAGGFGCRYTISASVPISRSQLAPRMRCSSPELSMRSSASRRSACGAAYAFQPLESSAESVLPMLVVHVGDGMVAVDERPRKETVLQASHLVLDLE